MTQFCELAFLVAQRLRTSEDHDAGYRATANRAYYASYHAAKLFHESLTSPGSVKNSSGSHEQLITQLDNPTIARDATYWTSKAMSKTLRVAYLHRVTADYFPNAEFTPNNADETLAASGTVISKYLASTR